MGGSAGIRLWCVYFTPGPLRQRSPVQLLRLCPAQGCWAEAEVRAGIQASIMALGSFNPIFSSFSQYHFQLCPHLKGHLLRYLILKRYIWARGGSYDIPRNLF